MRHYVPVPTDTGFAVAYCSTRGDFVAVMECATYQAAYEQSRDLTREELLGTMQAVQAAPQRQQARGRYPELM